MASKQVSVVSVTRDVLDDLSVLEDAEQRMVVESVMVALGMAELPAADDDEEEDDEEEDDDSEDSVDGEEDDGPPQKAAVRAIAVLRAHPKGIRRADLMRKIGTSSATITRVIRQFEKEGIVRRDGTTRCAVVIPVR